PPGLGAAGRSARPLDVPAAGQLGARAVARLPADCYSAWSPWVMAAALFGEARPVRASLLCHNDIQTQNRTDRKPGLRRRSRGSLAARGPGLEQETGGRRRPAELVERAPGRTGRGSGRLDDRCRGRPGPAGRRKGGGEVTTGGGGGRHGRGGCTAGRD